MKKVLRKILFGFLIFIFIVVGYFSIGSPPQAEEITWGVNFSQKYATNLGLDWKETYLALLNDLGTQNLRIAAHWDLIEPQEGGYYFEGLDWKIEKAEYHGAEIILAIGMKTPRWPECHIPKWAKDLNKEQQQAEILEMFEKIVLRYRDRVSVWAWQVENEPFLPFQFGICPWYDKVFLKKQVDLVRELDPDSQIIISATGEFSFWFAEAELADIVGITVHRRVWVEKIGRNITHHWFRPIYYYRRAQIINWLFDKQVICIELQAEPWGRKPAYCLSLKEQKETMNLEKFKNNVEFAKDTGLDTFYFWGAEWWYYLKEKHNQPDIWNEARKLFN